MTNQTAVATRKKSQMPHTTTYAPRLTFIVLCTALGCLNLPKICSGAVLRERKYHWREQYLLAL